MHMCFVVYPQTDTASSCDAAGRGPLFLLCLLGCVSARAVHPFFARRDRACGIGRFVGSIQKGKKESACLGCVGLLCASVLANIV